MLDQYEPIMSVQEVEEVLMIGKNTVYNNLIKTGKVDSFRIGRTWKIKRDSLLNYIKAEAGLTR